MVEPSTYRRGRYEDRRGGNSALRWFYASKPLLPRRAQLAARRLYARRQGRRAFPAWPIEPLLVDHRNEQLRRLPRASGDDRLALVNYWPDCRRFRVLVSHGRGSCAVVADVAC